MTSTEFNVGLGDGRCSSRVLKPPGGGHTNIFGGSGDGQKTKHMRGHQPTEIKECFQFDNEQKKKDIGESENNANNEQEQRKDERATPEKKAEQQTVPQQQRVRVPPGGFSSGLW